MRRVLLLAAVLGIAALGRPLSSATEFIAVGDSITAGSSFPTGITPAVIFDCTGGCAATSSGRENCGHARRIDDWIDGWMGAGNHVKNLGLGGEKTAGAVNRLPNIVAECGSPGDCNAMILMHGTNDMETNVSPETAAANLGFMIDEFKSRSIDTLLMSIIRDFNPNAAKWSNYHGLVVALAAAEDLQLVDTHATLCPTATCRNANYFLMGKPPCDTSLDLNVAHLDPDGYDVLTGLIQAGFPALAPAAPAPTSPAGDITEAMPEFVWPEVAAARWYELDVDTGVTWWEAAAHCTGGTCSVDPGVGLAKGAHSWRVRGRNLRGMGAWSADTPFDVWGVPGTPTPSAPEGLFIEADVINPPFEWEPYAWSEDPEATDYNLVVSEGGGAVLTPSFTSSICSGSVCTVSPGLSLAAGSYTWTVQARNPGAAGPASAPMAFQIWDQVPGEATPTGPTGEHFEPFAPLYEWLPAAGATEYDIEVKDMAGNVDDSATGLPAAVHCVSGSCSYQGGILASPDVYVLRVLARNSIGDGVLSTASADFTVLACDLSTKDLSTLEPSPVTTTEVVTHCGPVTTVAGAYAVAVGGDLTVHTRDGFIAHDDFSVEGDLTVRSP